MRRPTTVDAVETVMLEKFRTEPFHNLYLLQEIEPPSLEHGGTCSDKTRSFVSAAREAGFDVALHSGYIGGLEIHRLARVHIEGRVFFADVGNGWPALRLYPADQEVSYRCFGMRFRTEIRGPRLTVFHHRNGTESHQVEIDLRPKPENEIRADIAARFRSGVAYPFSKSLRFALVVDDRFLFLRGDRLEIYGDEGFEAIEGIGEAEVPGVLREYFRFDIRRLKSGRGLPRNGEPG
jgi:arylamine N-acetyltransferase